MIGGCAVNGNFLSCMLYYHPGWLALFVLAVIGVGIVVKVWRGP